jgi:hypothetical protein
MPRLTRKAACIITTPIEAASAGQTMTIPAAREARA